MFIRGYIFSTFLVGGIFASLLVILLAPPQNGMVLAIFKTGSSTQTLMAAVDQADARVVDMRPEQGLVFAWSAEAGLPARLRAAGAMIVLNPMAVIGCGGQPPPDPPLPKTAHP